MLYGQIQSCGRFSARYSLVSWNQCGGAQFCTQTKSSPTLWKLWGVYQDYRLKSVKYYSMFFDYSTECCSWDTSLIRTDRSLARWWPLGVSCEMRCNERNVRSVWSITPCLSDRCARQQWARRDRPRHYTLGRMTHFYGIASEGNNIIKFAPGLWKTSM